MQFWGEAVLFQAAYCLAFYVAFRVGELIAKSRKDRKGGLQVEWVKRGIDSVLISLPRSKTDQQRKGESIVLHRARDSPCCPVMRLEKFLDTRQQGVGGPLFIHADGTPLTRFQFRRVLELAMVQAHIDPKEFGTHSFRIGAATEAVAGGLRGCDVQRIGRWSSNCYKRYVRLHLL